MYQTIPRCGAYLDIDSNTRTVQKLLTVKGN